MGEYLIPDEGDREEALRLLREVRRTIEGLKGELSPREAAQKLLDEHGSLDGARRALHEEVSREIGGGP